MSSHRPFRFGIHTSLAVDGPAWAANARRIEELGFSSLLLRDHFDDQYAPLTAMAVAAAATQTLRVGCLVFDNDYRHPLVLAKELATLDVLSGGRVEAGIGAGWMAPDYEQSGMPFDPPGVRVSRMIEAVQIMKALFAGGPVDFAGEHYTITGHEATPRPVQQPGPPMFIAGGAPRMLRFAGAEADIIGLLPARTGNDAWQDQNLADATAAAMDRKIGWIREGAGDRIDDIEISVVVPALIPTNDRPKLAEAINGGVGDEVLAVDPDFAQNSQFVLIGSLDEMEAAMVERRERWGISYYIFNDTSLDAAAPLVARMAGR